MKIALYVENGLEQVVLTPETDTEKMILSKLHDYRHTYELKHGDFYACMGGWVREADSRWEDRSTMIVLRPKPEKQEAE